MPSTNRRKVKGDLPVLGSEDARAVTGARLPRCNPTVSGSCNHDELTCLRTDLIVDEGVCMTVNACENDRDCRDPVRSKCMGELVRETYGAKSELKAQNTYCLQSGCKVSGTSARRVRSACAT
jgi:hypothetical protein